MTSMIKVVLADDHALVRRTLGDWLNRLPDIYVAHTCDNADEALAVALQLKPDVVLLDIDMPGMHAFEAAKAILTRLPQTRVIFLSAFFNDRFIEQALAVKAAGYITKGEPPESIALAIRQIFAGHTCFSPEIQARIVIGPEGARLVGTMHTRTRTLSARELEILRYLARAMSRKEIAQTLHLSVHTIDRHTTKLMNKLDIHNRAELCRFAIREGLAEP